MKKTDWMLTVSVILYSYLFYKQSLGINFLLFNLFVVFSLLIREKQLIRNKYWLIAALSSVITSFCIFYYGNILSFLANFISLCLLSVLSINKNASVFLALFYAASSMATSVVFMFIDMVARRKQRSVATKTGVFTKILIGIIVLIVIILFFVLYQKSNPLFYNFTKDINLDFITAAWIFFTLGGLLLMYGFYYPLNFNDLHHKDLSNSNNLSEQNEDYYNQSKWRKLLSMATELNTGTILFVLLNIMLIVLNVLDINYLWINQQIPEGLTYASYVHQGIGTLILSIILAILIILFFFRSQLNFIKNNQAIKWLVYFWILQNILMVVSTGYRNLFYIHEYSLTYKRIGVYVYLILAIIGLITTLIKIRKRKSNWYLFRVNIWAAFLVLVFSSFFNWDMIISKYNINQSKKVDVVYLLNLSYKNLPLLLSHSFNEEELSYNNKDSFDYRNYPYNPYLYSSFEYERNLHAKLYKFLEKYQKNGWQSYCINKTKVYQEIMELEKAGSIDSIVLHSSNINTLLPLKDFINLKSLDFNNNRMKRLDDLKYFSKLNTLHLANNYIDSLDLFPAIKELTFLNISNNRINDLEAVGHLEKLEFLDLSKNQVTNISSLVGLKSLRVLNISGNPITDFSPLLKISSLKSLDLSDSPNINFNTIPVMHQLSEFFLNRNGLSLKNSDLLIKITTFRNLTGLYLSGNELENLNFISFYIHQAGKKDMPVSSVFDNLQLLDLSYCNLYDIHTIGYFKNLMELNVSSNKLHDIKDIALLKNLAVLNISNNNIQDISAVVELENLVKLNISNNKADSIPFLKSVNTLIELNASNNNIYSLSSIVKLKNLNILNVSNNNISNISRLTALKNLEVLYLTGNPIKDYSILSELKQLKEVTISGITKEQMNKLKASLPGTKIICNEWQ